MWSRPGTTPDDVPVLVHYLCGRNVRRGVRDKEVGCFDTTNCTFSAPGGAVSKAKKAPSEELASQRGLWVRLGFGGGERGGRGLDAKPSFPKRRITPGYMPCYQEIVDGSAICTHLNQALFSLIRIFETLQRNTKYCR